MPPGHPLPSSIDRLCDCLLANHYRPVHHRARTGVLVLIMLFEGLLKKEGYLARMLDSLPIFFPVAASWRLRCPPSFIGLMPSMGGALFSAPLVAQATADTTPALGEKALYQLLHYRHIWNYCLPLAQPPNHARSANCPDKN